MGKKTRTIISLVEDNALLQAAITNLRIKMINDAESRKNGRILLNEDELNEVLAIAGFPMVDTNDYKEESNDTL